MSEISKKLRLFINKEFKTQIPKNYKLYEKCKAEKSGTYKFKFSVVLGDDFKMSQKSKYENLSEDKLIALFSEFKKQYATNSDGESYKHKVKAIQNILMLKHGHSDSDIKNLIEPDKAEIIYDPYENEDDIEQDY